MKRQLFKQMRHEWRSNIWMIVELTVVSLVIWIIFGLFIELIMMRNTHFGYNLDDVYVADLKYIPKTSSSFHPYDSAHSYYTDLELLRGRFASNPYVEMIGFGSNALPYNYNFSGWRLEFSDGASTYYYFGNTRYLSPEVVKIMRLEGLNGETSEQLAQLLEKGEFLISNTDANDNPREFLGKDLIIGGDSSSIARVSAAVYGIRRSDYESLFSGVVIVPAGKWESQVILRVKPGMGRQFEESVTPKDLEMGNVYFSTFRSVDKLRDEAHKEINILIRNMSVCALFLCIVVFLGFLGAFWFRVQQRVDEIAVRKVNGATVGDISRRLISEGLILLLCSTVLAVAIECVVVKMDILREMMSYEASTPYLSMCVTAGVLALMIVCGIWFPVRQAIKINPALALKDQ